MADAKPTHQTPDATTTWYLALRVAQDPVVRLTWREARDSLKVAHESPSRAVSSVMRALGATTASWARNGEVAPLSFSAD